MRPNDVVDGFVSWMTARGLAEASVRLYREGLARFARTHGDVDLRAVTRRDVEAYAEELRAAGLSAATLAVQLRALRRLYDYLVETQRVFAHPLEGLVVRRAVSLPGRTLSEDQARRLLDTPSPATPTGVRDRALLELLYATGLRRGEVCALTPEDVDLDGGRVLVRAGKGGHARAVLMTGEARRRLALYLGTARVTLAPSGAAALFVGRGGRGLGAAAVLRIIRVHALAAGLGAGVSCHALRRTLATQLLRAGADVASVAELLGHARLSSTQRYALLAANDVRDAHARTHPRGGDDDAPRPR